MTETPMTNSDGNNVEDPGTSPPTEAVKFDPFADDDDDLDEVELALAPPTEGVAYDPDAVSPGTEAVKFDPFADDDDDDDLPAEELDHLLKDLDQLRATQGQFVAEEVEEPTDITISDPEIPTAATFASADPSARLSLIHI